MTAFVESGPIVAELGFGTPQLVAGAVQVAENVKEPLPVPAFVTVYVAVRPAELVGTLFGSESGLIAMAGAGGGVTVTVIVAARSALPSAVAVTVPVPGDAPAWNVTVNALDAPPLGTSRLDGETEQDAAAPDTVQPVVRKSSSMVLLSTVNVR